MPKNSFFKQRWGFDVELLERHFHTHTLLVGSPSEQSHPANDHAPCDVIEMCVKAYQHQDTRFRIVRAGVVCDPGAYCINKRIDLDRVLRLFRHEGCSIIIRDQGVAYYLGSPIDSLVASAMPFCTYRPVEWGLFVSPPASIGLQPHFDAHAVLIKQLHGAKHWDIWPAYTSIDDEFSVPPRFFELTAAYANAHRPVLSAALEAESTLFLPKCTVHAPRSKERASVHLSIFLMGGHRISPGSTGSKAEARIDTAPTGYREKAHDYSSKPGID